MTRNHAELETLGDRVLAEMSRAYDDEAFAELWRRHAGAGTSAARQFTAIADPQDIVSEAYIRILGALRRGGGPHDAFRPYLYRTIRNIALDWRPRHPSVALEETGDLVDPEHSIEITVMENAVTAAAFEKLPERWQAVLWYLEVEGMSISDAAPLLGLSPNATSALAARAHEGFKKAWLQAHVNDRSVPAECRWTTERMARYVRHSLTKRSRGRFDRHVDDCDRCALLLQEIGELGNQLATVLLPITLGTTVGSLLLAQLRDHTAVTVASTLAPTTAPAATAILSGAAAMALVVSGAILVVPPAEQPRPLAESGGQAAPSSAPPSSSAAEPDQGPMAPPPTETSPPEPVVSAEVVSAEPGVVPATPPPATTPTETAPPPLIDVSVSLLSGAIELDAVVDLNPSTGLLVQIIPGLGLLGG